MNRVVAAVALGVVVLIGAGAASCGPERSPPAQTPAISEAPERSSPTGPVGDRHSNLDVASGMRPHTIEFFDAETGYLLFLGCANRCQGALFVSFDGGQSWLERKIPVTSADNIQLHVVDAKTLVLLAEPQGWFLSSDAGRTFARGGSALPDPAVLFRGVTAGCPTTGDCSPQVLFNGKPLQTQPPLIGQLRDAAGALDRPVWAVSTKDLQVHTAMSPDGGRTWQKIAPPLAVANVSAVQLQVSPDGGDVWLVVGSGSGPVGVYRIDGPAWRQINANLDLGSGRVACAAAGEGVLAAAGTQFVFLHRDGRWVRARRPFSAQWVRTLKDGTLLALTGPGDVWLGVGRGAARTWTRVTVEAV